MVIFIVEIWREPTVVRFSSVEQDYFVGLKFRDIFTSRIISCQHFLACVKYAEVLDLFFVVEIIEKLSWSSKFLTVLA